METLAPYTPIVEYLERCFELHGDSHLGFDWPNPEHVIRRHQVMLESIRRPGPSTSLLDFGCGAAHLYETIRARGMDWVEYEGLDLSSRFIGHCRHKYPDVPFTTHNILEAPLDRSYDYIIANGIFTVKLEASYESFLDYMMETLQKLWLHSRVGIAFNVMSTCVDWERDDLFHLPLDTAHQKLTEAFGRHLVFRHDYGLYEYTVYLYHDSASEEPLLARPFAPRIEPAEGENAS